MGTNWELLDDDCEQARLVIAGVTGIHYGNYKEFAQRALNEQGQAFVVAKYWDAVLFRDIPVVNAMLSAFGACHCQMFVCSPNHKSQWHIDGNVRNACVNIPYMNSVGVVHWTDQELRLSATENTVYTKTLISDEKLVEVSDSCCAPNGIVALRTSKWHMLDSSTCNDYRLTFSVRATSNPTFEQLVKALNER